MHPSIKRARATLERLNDVEEQYASERAWRGDPLEMWQTPEPKVKPKTYELRPASQQQQSTAMDAATEAKWNEWCDARIAGMIGPDSAHFDGIAEALSLLRAEQDGVIAEVIKALRNEFDTKLGGLRVDQAVNRSVTKGELKHLQRLVGRAHDA